MKYTFQFDQAELSLLCKGLGKLLAEESYVLLRRIEKDTDKQMKASRNKDKPDGKSR